MFTFTKMTDWQDDPAVKQILVFPNDDTKEIFNKDFAVLVEKEGIANASDSNLGAVYKLRAVKDSKGQWIPVIRCGITGMHLWESHDRFNTPDVAIKMCVYHLGITVAANCEGLVKDQTAFV